jgi:hypothetical protein
MIYIATTTINSPTQALKKFAKNNNCKVIVALDKKSKPFKLKNTIVLTTDCQAKKWPKLSRLIGWNCIQRRNFAILEAFERGAEIVALIDDDNIPYKNWFEEIYLYKKIRSKLVSINRKVFDPVGFTNHKNLWHRGYPLELINKRKYKIKGTKLIMPDIQANFWDGDPDVDAITRFIFAPECKFKRKYFPFHSNKISPFNSQNTLLKRKVIKDYFLFPHVGRMDDIWASYYVTSKKYKVIYGEPTVYQNRNVHNYLTDFKNEIVGYKNNLKLIDDLYKNSENIFNYLPKNSAKAFNEWKKIISKNKK